MVDGGQVLPVADLAATVEAVEGTGNVLMVRLFEGRGAAAVGMGGAPLPPGAGPEAQQKRMKALLAGLVDVQVIMEVGGRSGVDGTRWGSVEERTCAVLGPERAACERSVSERPSQPGPLPHPRAPPCFLQTMKDAIKKAVLVAR